MFKPWHTLSPYAIKMDDKYPLIVHKLEKIAVFSPCDETDSVRAGEEGKQTVLVTSSLSSIAFFFYGMCVKGFPGSSSAQLHLLVEAANARASRCV